MIIKPKSNRTKGIIASSFMVFALVAQPMYGAIAGGIAAAEEVNTTNIQQIATEPAVENTTPAIATSEEETISTTSVFDAEEKEDTEKLATTENSSSSTNTLSTPALLATPVSTNVARNSTTNVEYDSLQDAINAATSGDTIVLLSDITVTSQISINKTITIDGNNKSITANFTRNGNNNDSVIGVYGEANTATIKNIILNGGGVGRDLHGIDVYISNVVLDNLTIQNTARTAVQLNGSVGTISNINTKDTAKKKSWVFYSFNVITLNKGGSVTRDPKLTIGGKNSHNETPLFNGNHIRIESGEATDTNGQYTNGNTRNLINNINAPAIATPTQNQILDTNDVTISWNAITKTNSTQAAVSYNYKIDNGTVVNTTATSVTPNLANGTHTVAVQAVSASGLESAWSADRTFTVDANQLPQATITTPAENGTVSTRINGNKLNVKGTFTDDKAVNHLQLELVKDGNLVTSYTMHYNDAGLQSNDNFEVNIPVAANLADGQYNLIYTATDFENGVGPRTDHFFNIDNTKPTVTLVKPSVDIQGKNVQIEVSAEDAVGLSRITANIYKDGETTVYKPTSTAVQNGETAATHTASVELESGRYFVRYNAQDTAKNTSTTTDYYFTVDADIPSAKVTKHTVNKDALSFKGEVEDPNLRYYYYYLTTDQVVTVDGHTFTPGQEIRLNNNTTSSRNTETVWAASGQTKFDGNLGGFNIKNVPDGNYTINLVAYDTLGNNNVATPATYKFYLDRTAPTEVKILSPATNSVFHTVNGEEVQLTAKDSVGLKRFDVTVWAKDDNRLDKTTIKASWGIEVPAGNKDKFETIFNLPSNLNLNDGEYVIYFTATDLAGNPTNAESVYFTINTQAPKAEITVDGLIDGFTKNKNITITGTGTPGEYGTPIKTHFFELKTPGPDGETYAIYSFKNSAGNTCTLDGTNVCSFDLTKYYKGDGEYKIRYVVTDEQGIRNDGFQQSWAKDPAPATFTFNVDTTGPVVEGPANIDDATVYNPNGDITITATDENGSGVKNVVGHIYKKDTNGDYKLHKNNSVNGDTLTIASSVFGALGEGEYYIEYNAHDNVGNVSKTTLYYFTIDTIAPEIKITSTGPFTTARPTITGTVDKDATIVEVLVDGVWVKADYSARDDTWSYTYTTDLANGDHSIQVRATDTAGNTGSNESPGQPGFAQATFAVNVPTPEVPTTPETPPTTPEATVVTPPAGTLAVQTTTNPTAATEDATVDGEEEVLGTSTERERSASVLAATDNKTDSDNEWSIVNAIAAVITVLISIIALAGISKKQGKGKTLSAVTAIPAIGAVVAFFMLENLSSPMVFLNAWSWLFVGVLAVQVFILAMTKQKSSDNE